MRKLAKSCSRSLKDLMSDEQRGNAWVVSGAFEFYVRKGRISMKHNKVSCIKPCLMVANVHLRSCRGREGRPPAYQMIDFMKELEASAVQSGYAGVFVEMVLDPRIGSLLRRFGYRRAPQGEAGRPCYFISTSGILSRKRCPERRFYALQRPSLRGFLRDASIEEYWLCEQQQNVMMLVRRGRTAQSHGADRTRLSVLNLYHHTVDAAAPLSAHSFYWSEDEQVFTELLRKLEARVVSAGFEELAVYSGAISCLIKTKYGYTNVGAEPKSADLHMIQLGYLVERSARGGKIYVKPLQSCFAA